jgi:hypothetical protein
MHPTDRTCRISLKIVTRKRSPHLAANIRSVSDAMTQISCSTLHHFRIRTTFPCTARMYWDTTQLLVRIPAARLLVPHAMILMASQSPAAPAPPMEPTSSTSTYATPAPPRSTDPMPAPVRSPVPVIRLQPRFRRIDFFTRILPDKSLTGFCCAAYSQ